VDEIFKNIHWAFEKIVQELNWMDDTTKQRTIYKAQKMENFIGFPQYIYNSSILDNYYSDVPISLNNLLVCNNFLYYLNDYFEHLFSLKY